MSFLQLTKNGRRVFIAESSIALLRETAGNKARIYLNGQLHTFTPDESFNATALELLRAWSSSDKPALPVQAKKP